MPQPAFLLLMATVLPLFSFVILLFMGKRMGKIAGFVGTAAIAASFVFSMLALIVWVSKGDQPDAAYGKGNQAINLRMNWIPTDIVPSGSTTTNGFLQVGIYVDSLTVTMFCMITLVSTLVFVFSIGYMADDKRFPRFFTYLSLFCFSML